MSAQRDNAQPETVLICSSCGDRMDEGRHQKPGCNGYPIRFVASGGDGEITVSFTPAQVEALKQELGVKAVIREQIGHDQPDDLVQAVARLYEDE